MVNGIDDAKGLLRFGRTRAFTETYARISGNRDMLVGVKDRLNREALGYRIAIGSYRDMLELIAMANSVDWRMRGYSSLGVDLGSRRVFVDDRVVEQVESADTVVVALDNAGEAVVDLQAAGWLASRGHRVYIVAREYPYELDVTAREASILAGILGLEGVEVLSTGSMYPPLYLPRLDARVLDVLRGADVVIAKGIANLEAGLESWSMKDAERVVVALRAKCEPVARLLGVGPGDPVVSRLAAYMG